MPDDEQQLQEEVADQAPHVDPDDVVVTNEADGADDRDQRYEVVIAPEDGLDEGYAKRIREKLLGDGYREDAVEVREVKDV